MKKSYKLLGTKLAIDTLFCVMIFAGGLFIADLLLPGIALTKELYAILLFCTLLATLTLFLYSSAIEEEEEEARTARNHPLWKIITITLTIPIFFLATRGFDLIPQVAIILLATALVITIISDLKSPQ